MRFEQSAKAKRESRERKEGLESGLVIHRIFDVSGHMFFLVGFPWVQAPDQWRASGETRQSSW
jgi:hypothetical protein